MKVAFFLGALKRGGAESLTYDICMKRNSAPFEICCVYRKNDDYSQAFKDSGVELIQISRTGWIFRYLWRLRKAILDSHTDIVHAQTPSNALVSCFALLFTHVRIVTSFHGFSFSNAPKWYQKIVYGCSKRIICVSVFEKEYYMKRWNLSEDNKLNVIYNGIDFSKLDKPEPDLSHPIHINDNTLNMIMVGSFIEGRDQLFICRVLNSLHRKGISFNMYFAGRRDDLEYWRYDKCVSYCKGNNLNDKVFFLGNRTDIPYLLHQMDLFIYASEHDTFGIAIIEALASGLPVVVNDWAVMEEITRNGRYAKLYQTNNIDDCVNKICSFMKNDDKSHSKIIQSVVREQYSVERHISELNKVYLSCIR